MSDIARNNGHTVDESSRGDEGITIVHGIRNVESSTSLRNGKIYLENAP